MIPLVGEIKELAYCKKTVVETADAVIKAAGSNLKYEVGTMIEIPRAALTADEIAKEAEFFCFGTNDLTQMTFGFSRDDASKFLPSYYADKIFEYDPFARLDTVAGNLWIGVKLGHETASIHSVSAVSTAAILIIEFCPQNRFGNVSCSLSVSYRRLRQLINIKNPANRRGLASFDFGRTLLVTYAQ